QAEDGIRDLIVTGVQTCALPILFFEATSSTPGVASLSNASSRQWNWNLNAIEAYSPAGGGFKATTSAGVQVEDREIERSRVVARSEERRVGKECRAGRGRESGKE